MPRFELKIIASDHIFYEGPCEQLIVPAQDGEVGILAHHAPLILATVEGSIRFQAPGDERWIRGVVGRGILRVANNRALMVTSFAEHPEQIDAKRAKLALERAKEQLRQKQSLREFKLYQASMARALSRLRGVGMKEIQ
ncbi:MAG TPA: ATP synthase F1 subunit epsilon [Candidatus Lachnoclostridium stercoravium]|uniref:ATP synthase epsilon chain n=1 Tax=Candidatus Lachnoclostridium stercoravium TaxID=2838633 RepID=A0A9D2KPQ4_9FIRM|nr:ATP synthase F1 subunit epsilon [Candidatus Lachnoclostridium stercoravium]